MAPINDRRSIRKFLDKEIPLELIKEILEAGRMAPSPKNRQPWKYIVFGNKQKQELLDCMELGIKREEHTKSLLPKSASGIPDAKNTLRIMREAPIIILVLNTNGKSPFLTVDPDERIMEICDTLSIGASIENILLRAEELELGTLWIANTCFAYGELVEYLCTDKQLVGAIAVGYANENPHPRPRKALEEIVEMRV
ncbi:MAG: nitroreductase [Lachnospiraceae bacterium]|nr:nitroreductase [Lachnospiraceae bacterium]